MEVFLALGLYAKASATAQRSFSAPTQETCSAVNTFGNSLLGIENMKGIENHALFIHTRFSASFASSCHSNTCPIAVELPKTAGATVMSFPHPLGMPWAYPSPDVPRVSSAIPLNWLRFHRSLHI